MLSNRIIVSTCLAESDFNGLKYIAKCHGRTLEEELLHIIGIHMHDFCKEIGVDSCFFVTKNLESED